MSETPPPPKPGLPAVVRSWLVPRRGLLPLLADATPIDLRFVGRTLFHAALVGLAAGLAGAAFFGALEYAQALLLEGLAGYRPLRAHGETFAASHEPSPFRPWVLLLLPALGGLACGLVTRLAPEARGGGAEAMLEAFHHRGGKIRRRVLWVKPFASLFTLATGGSGGREGPTMHLGGAIGANVAHLLRVSTRERRILLVAGVAAGISAVFRTPLGAALLAVEVLYRDGFESDALIPSVLASVVAYSVVISIYGESTLFAHAARFPFVPAHLPLYALLALVVALFATAFVAVYGAVRTAFAAMRAPEWVRPAAGGLLLGLLATPIVAIVGEHVQAPGQGLGLLGGGYGAVQMAISGSAWLPPGWQAVALLVILAVAKIVAASVSIGSGGSAGDFAPSLVIGGLVGGAFGRAAQLVLGDPRIDPGAFALVGMGVFYGGIAHVPLAALVLVCELAGNYDLLVPLMLAMGIGFIALRRRALYHGQVSSARESPAHRDAFLLDVLTTMRVRDVVTVDRPFVSFAPATPSAEMLRHVSEATWQHVFPVIDGDGQAVGMVTTSTLALLALEREDTSWALAADVMQPLVSLSLHEDLRRATDRIVEAGLRELPVVDAGGRIVGFLDESEIARLYLKAAVRAEESLRPEREE